MTDTKTLYVVAEKGFFSQSQAARIAECAKQEGVRVQVLDSADLGKATNHAAGPKEFSSSDAKVEAIREALRQQRAAEAAAQKSPDRVRGSTAPQAGNPSNAQSDARVQNATAGRGAIQPSTHTSADTSSKAPAQSSGATSGASNIKGTTSASACSTAKGAAEPAAGASTGSAGTAAGGSVGPGAFAAAAGVKGMGGSFGKD